MKRLAPVCVVAIVFCSSAWAHEMRPAYLELKQTDVNTYDMLWKVPARGPNKRLSLHVTLPADCHVVVPASTRYVQGAFIDRSVIRREGGLGGARIAIDGLSRTMTDVLVRIEHLNGVVQAVRLKPDTPSFTVGNVPGTSEVAGTYCLLGIEHILVGIDHLLFLGCLVLIAGTGKRILITVTGFTIAHSITLALSALNVVQVPVPPVEAVIALSIVFLAVEIARESRDTLTYRYPIAVSSSFGLLHGFGFAAVLSQIGLPQGEIPTALLFFNVGVEIGQLAFIAVLLFLSSTLRLIVQKMKNDKELTAKTMMRLRLPAAYVTGSVAAFWMIQRVVGFWV